MNRKEWIAAWFRRHRQTTAGCYVAGQMAIIRLREARTARAWDMAENAGLVRIRIEDDDCPDVSWAEDDKTMMATIERHGMVGVIGEYRTHPDSETWGHGGSIWNVVGNDTAHVMTDIQEETLDELRKALRMRGNADHHKRIRDAAQATTDELLRLYLRAIDPAQAGLREQAAMAQKHLAALYAKRQPAKSRESAIV